jgi:hypothetical protein
MKYETLDKLILTRLTNSIGVPFCLLNNSEIHLECGRIAGPREETFRVLDKRLQALRRAGKIVFERKTGWRLS